MSRGLRNNNPLNIRNNPDKFQGEIKPSTDKAFKQFSTPAYGYRAAFVTLGTYLSRGKNTIEKIIGSWAPPSENNTDGYIEKVERWSGISRNKILTVDSGEDYVKIVIAMSRVENGVPAVPTDVRNGFDLQNKIKTHLY
ncbi:MAG: structural protein P5 [Dysgonamonadaceae bacterium]|nr:structural protein P5 [Dysgonamonadaceae bacterium]